MNRKAFLSRTFLLTFPLIPERQPAIQILTWLCFSKAINQALVSAHGFSIKGPRLARELFICSTEKLRLSCPKLEKGRSVHRQSTTQQTEDGQNATITVTVFNDPENGKKKSRVHSALKPLLILCSPIYNILLWLHDIY